MCAKTVDADPSVKKWLYSIYKEHRKWKCSREIQLHPYFMWPSVISSYILKFIIFLSLPVSLSAYLTVDLSPHTLRSEIGYMGLCVYWLKHIAIKFQL